MDYKALLAKYIALVGECERTSFIERLRSPGCRGYGYAHGFNEAEIDELERVEELAAQLIGRGQLGLYDPPRQIVYSS